MKRRRDGVGKRRRAREMALQMLYQHEMGSSTLQEIVSAFDHHEYTRETMRALAEGDAKSADDAKSEDNVKIEDDKVATIPDVEETDPKETESSFVYARTLVEGVGRHAESIDEQIRRHAENWRLERMPVIDRNILRLAIYEMLHESGVPKVVIVDEAIELAKKFGSENSGRFVNGLLDGVLKGDLGEALAGSNPSGVSASRTSSGEPA